MQAAEYISNTSPLVYLHQIGELELLPRLFRRIVVPGAVEAELAAGRTLGYALPDVGALLWVDVRRDIRAPRTILAYGDLGSGEREVLWLAAAIPGMPADTAERRQNRRTWPLFARPLDWGRKKRGADGTAPRLRNRTRALTAQGLVRHTV